MVENLTRLVYLDNSATTRVLPEVMQVMVECMDKNYGNPSSLHGMGIEAEKIISKSRRQIAQFFGCKPKEMIFTSGGSESNNLAIKGIVENYKKQGNHIITTKIEHPSVLAVCEQLEKEGFDVTYLSVDNKGRISLQEMEENLTSNTILVSIMMVNNELGTVQPIQQIGQLIKSKNNSTFFHVDGVQAAGIMPIKLNTLHVDLFSFSAHKFHGPKGVGGLFVRDGVKLKPLIIGGGQENLLRSGTENVPGIAGMAKAISLIDTATQSQKIRSLQVALWQGISKEVENCKLNSDLEHGAPHILSVSFAGVKGEVILHYLESEGIYVSTGSACSSRSRNISHVLNSIGLNDLEADGTIRYSLSQDISLADIDYAVEKTVVAVRELKQVMRR